MISLRGGRTERVHCSRLLNYRDYLLEKLIPQDILDLAQRTESHREDCRPQPGTPTNSSSKFSGTAKPKHAITSGGGVSNLVTAFLASCKKRSRRHSQAPCSYSFHRKSPAKALCAHGSGVAGWGSPPSLQCNGLNTFESYRPILFHHGIAHSHLTGFQSISL